MTGGLACRFDRLGGTRSWLRFCLGLLGRFAQPNRYCKVLHVDTNAADSIANGEKHPRQSTRLGRLGLRLFVPGRGMAGRLRFRNVENRRASSCFGSRRFDDINGARAHARSEKRENPENVFSPAVLLEPEKPDGLIFRLPRGSPMRPLAVACRKAARALPPFDGRIRGHASHRVLTEVRSA